MRSLAIGRQVRKREDAFELRETQSAYNAIFHTEKGDIEGENLFYWDDST
jgi:hypothetical protein